MTSLLAPDDVATDVVPGVEALHAVIDRLQTTGVSDGRSPRDYDAEIAEYERAIRRMESLKLRLVAAADATRVAERTGLADTSSWLAQRTRSDAAAASRDVSLAIALAPADQGPVARPCAGALARGDFSPEHARVIVKTTAQLPPGLGAAAVEKVERDLVEKAQRLSPGQLRRVARRALEAVETDHDVVDRHEDQLLRTEEDAALARTRLTMHDNGDGTTSGHFTVPTAASAILRKVIHSMTAPRRAALGATDAQAGGAEERRDWSRRAGVAFVELLEHLPTDRLHGKVAATVVVTLDLARLRAGVGAAGLDTGDVVSAGELRRIACGAGILPAVLDANSVPLDLGRSSRLFTEAQRVALATKHSTCAARGCERPFSWTELHHRDPWSHGGRTNLADAVPLCGFHHRRIHDPRYDHRDEPDGIAFIETR